MASIARHTTLPRGFRAAAFAASRRLSRRRSGGLTLSPRHHPQRLSSYRLHSYRRYPHRCAYRRHPRRWRVSPIPRKRHLLLLQNARYLHLVRHRGAGFYRGCIARVDLRLELRVVVTNVRQVFEPEVMLLSGVLLRFKRERAAGRASVRNSRGGGTDLGVELWRVPRARREFAGTHRVVR